MTIDAQYDVIIVGAGFAGAVAARELSRGGRRVCLIEARDRVGGRTWVDERLGRRLELGGTWVHWSQPHVWAELTRYGLSIEASPTPEIALLRGPDGLLSIDRADFLDRLARLNERLFAGAERAFEFPYDPLRAIPDDGDRDRGAAATSAAAASAVDDATSLATRIAALGLPEDDDLLLRSYWTVAFNGRIDDASFAQAQRWLSLADGDWRSLFRACNGSKIVGGTAALMRGIVDDCDAEIRLGTRVTRIESGPEATRVRTADGEVLTCRDAVLTAPMHALDGLELSPPLSGAARRAVDRGHVGLGAKVWISVRGEQRHFVAFGSPDLPLNMIRSEFVRDGNTILVGFGPAADAIDVTDVAQVRAAVARLRDDLEVLDCAGHDWVADPLSRETWPMHRVGFLSHGLAALQRPLGRIHLAGSDFAAGWCGFIDGAIESGLSVSRRILEAAG